MHHSMTFYWSSDIGDFFFNGLTINTPGAFSALCIVLVALSIVYEAMKVNSAKVRARAARERLRATSCAPSETANLLVTEQQPANTDRCFSRRTLKLLGEAVVFLLHNTLGYALMLSVMIYNGYLFVMVVLGMGAGYFLFGHISMRVNMENMQARTVKVLCSPMCPPSEDEPRGFAARPRSGSHHRDQLGHCSSAGDGPSSVSSTTAVLHHISPDIHQPPPSSPGHHANYQSTNNASLHCGGASGDCVSEPNDCSSSTGSSNVTHSCRL